MNDVIVELCPALASMRAICAGEVFARPTPFQAKLQVQFDDPKGFEKFMARLERLEAEHAQTLRAVVQKSPETAEVPDVAPDDAHEKLEGLIDRLLCDVEESTPAGQTSQSRQPKP